MSDFKKWFKCIKCGYEWEYNDVTITTRSWYDPTEIVICKDCEKSFESRLDVGIDDRDTFPF